MSEFIALVIGFILGAAVVYLVARNNKKRFTDALNLAPGTKWAEILNKLREKL